MVISIYNHKGGTGKTTVTVNLGKALCDLGYAVLLIDIDPQANLSYSLGIELTEENDQNTFINIFETNEGIDILANQREPAFQKSPLFNSEYELSEIMTELKEQYDVILIDCPPSQSIDVEGALLASDKIIIPTLLDALSLEGLRQVIEGIQVLNEKHNSNIEILGILPTIVNSRRKLSAEVLHYMKSNYSVPTLQNHIRMDVRLAEAPSFSSSVIEYAPKSRSAQNFRKLAKEIEQLA